MINRRKNKIISLEPDVGDIPEQHIKPNITIP